MRSDTQLWTRHEMDMGDGMPEEVFHMPATPEEIKACHGKCGTCKHFDDDQDECGNEDSNCFAYEMNPATDYCNHHEPKEE